MVSTAVPIVDIGQSERIDNGIRHVFGNRNVVDGVQRLEVSWRRPRTGRTNGKVGHMNTGNETVIVKKVTGELCGTNNIGTRTWANLMAPIMVTKYDAGVPSRENKSHNKFIKSNAFFGEGAGGGVQ